MSTFGQLSPAPVIERPFPPAVTVRHAAQPAQDDVVLMPPFSRATMELPRASDQALEAPVPEVSPPPTVPTAPEVYAPETTPVADTYGPDTAFIPGPEASVWTALNPDLQTSPTRAEAGLPAMPGPVHLPLAPQPERDLAEAVAERLEGLAEELRRLGFQALVKPRSEQEPIDVVLASIITGFLARR